MKLNPEKIFKIVKIEKIKIDIKVILLNILENKNVSSKKAFIA